MPKGFIDKNLKNPLNYIRAEWQQALRTGQNPKTIKSALQDSWVTSDSRKAFEHALQDRGDRRGYVAVNTYGEIYSLPRQIGVKKADLAKKLGKAELLPSVAETKNTISGRLSKQFKSYSDELKFKHKQEMTPLIQARQEMTQNHRESRKNQKLTHEKRWQVEELERSARLRKGFKGIWDRLTSSHQKPAPKMRRKRRNVGCAIKRKKNRLSQNSLPSVENCKLNSSNYVRNKPLNAPICSKAWQYQSLGHQNEIRKLWEQEKIRMRQTIKNSDSTDHDPEI